MPWKVSDPVSERMVFVTRLQAGEQMSELCREFGISRKTGYKYLERFQERGAAGLFDVPRRPKRLARLLPEPIRQLCIEARGAHPTWGPRKLRSWLQVQHPGVELPAPSTMGDWLRQAGLVKRRKRVLRVTPYGDQLARSQQPNDVWCVDYKGQFRMGNGKYCYPLTVADHFSRYFLCCEGFEAIDGEAAKLVFEDLFSRYGLPKYIRSDNGAPFASRGLLGLTRLSVFWLKHGVIPERIAPGHPEQNGRLERTHRTLKEETTRPAGANLLQQQERFDCFREEFNEERPHEALGQRRPAEIYQLSERRMRGGELDYPLHDEVVRVHANGHVNLLHRRKGQVFISLALAGERIGVRELDAKTLILSFANLELGCWDLTKNRFQPADGALQEEPGADPQVVSLPPCPPHPQPSPQEVLPTT